MQNLLNHPITKLGLSEEDAKKLSEALHVQTVKDLATNEHFLVAQNCYLLAQANAKPVDTENKHPLLELVSSITGATVLFGALLYLAGWSYLYQYYKSFGIRVSDLNLPVNDALVYSMTVIFKDFWSVFWLVIVIIIFFATLTIRRVSRWLLKPIAVGVFVLLILVLGAVLSKRGTALGQAQAQEDMKEIGVNLPKVRLNVIAEAPAGNAATKDSAGEQKVQSGTSNSPHFIPGATEEDFSQAGFKLLIHANQHYYLFRPLKDIPSQPASNLFLYVVPDSRVRSVRIERGI